MLLILSAMLLVFVTWWILLAAFAGVGLVLRRLAGLPDVTTPDILLLSFWVGFALTIGVLQVWHLAFPVDGRIAIIMLIIGAAGLLWNRRAVWQVMTAKRVISRRMLPLMLLWVVFFLWLSNRALNLPLESDSGYYHLPTILWIKSYPIVPGLGNLYPLLGYNNVSFLYAALLDTGIWEYHSHHLVNTLLMFALFNQVFLYLVRLVRHPSDLPVEYGLGALLTGVLIMDVVSIAIASPGTDYPAGFLAVVVLIQVLSYLRGADTTKKETVYRTAVIWLLCTVGMTIKLSYVPYFAGMALLITLHRWRGYGLRSLWTGQRILPLMLVYCAVYLVIWIARGIIVSGYPAFPATVFPLPVDWRLPPEIAQEVSCGFRSLGFYNTGTCRPIAGWDWLVPWIQVNLHDLFFFPLPLALLSIGTITGLVNFRRGGPLAKYLLPLLPVTAMLIFWFVSAPQIRFAEMALWLFTTMVLLLAVLTLPVATARKTGLVLVIAALIAVYPVYLAVRTQLILTIPGADNGFYGYKAIAIPSNEFVTDSGLTVYVPAGQERCWMSNLLCTGSPEAALRLRVPGDISQGFTLEPPDR